MENDQQSVTKQIRYLEGEQGGINNIYIMFRGESTIGEDRSGIGEWKRECGRER